jgi:hypothetical protein
VRDGTKNRVKGGERNIRRWLGWQDGEREDNEETRRQVESSRRTTGRVERQSRQWLVQALGISICLDPHCMQQG